MRERWMIKMWCFLVLCPVLLVGGAQTLSIDSQLGTSIEDCFERISIGEQLPASAIYRNVTELTTRECEQICKLDKQCQAYDYGVGAKGNATCDLSNQGEKDLKEKNLLNRNPDYDVYIRRFQCEQGPPSPLKPLQDEGEGPTHRPVFRPEVDEPKRPLADDYLDSRPFETTRPDPYRPYEPPYLNHIDRPDDYHNQAPVYDKPPSYGLHRPQDIPYRPEKPYQNHSDPYDILQFQGDRPQYPGFRPDPYYPPRPSDEIPDIYGPPRPPPGLPPYRPEKPEFVYITRPNKKPVRPNDDIGYGNKPVKPDYHDPRPPYKPSRPADYPYGPYDRPSYDYNSQYASSYGQNQYNDNSIYLEIYDPPRPYKPGKPNKPYGSNYGQDYGYGSQDGYGGSHFSQNYGSGSQGDNLDRPLDSYQPQTGSGYGIQDLRPEKPYNKPKPVYGPPPQEPLDYKPQKPSYNSGSSYGPSQFESFGSQSGYGSQTPHKPQDGYQKPSYNDKPSYGSNKPAYDSNLPTYGNNRPSYDDNRPAYDISKPTYGDHRPSYGNNGPSYDNHRPVIGNDRPSYDNNKPSYDNNKPSYGNSQGFYGSSQSFGSSSYGNRPVQSGYQQFNSHQSSYGSTSHAQGSYQQDQQPYGSPAYDGPLYDDAYGNRPNDQSYNKPLYDKPLYKPPVNKPVFNPPYEKPSYDNNRPNNKPGYNDKPDDPYNRPSKPDRPYQPEFDKDRPDGSYGQEDSGGYKSNRPKPNQTDGYNGNKPDIKPVYEFEFERPGNVPSYIVRPSGEVITSRPVTVGDYGRPGHGREPPVSYRGK